MGCRVLNGFQRSLLREQAGDNGDGGGSGGSKGGAGGADSKENKVAHETYQKVLDEKKAEQRKREELEAQLGELKKEVDTFKTEKLKIQGDKDELIKTLEQKLKDNEAKIQAETTKFKLTKVVSAFRELAVKEGCQNVDDLQKLVSDRFKDIKVDPQNFEIDLESVKSIISESKEKKSYLFDKKRVAVDDINLGGGGNQESYIQELKKCKTQKELDACRKKHGRA